MKSRRNKTNKGNVSMWKIFICFFVLSPIKSLHFYRIFFFFLCGLAKNFFIISLLADIWEFRDIGEGGGTCKLDKKRLFPRKTWILLSRTTNKFPSWVMSFWGWEIARFDIPFQVLSVSFLDRKKINKEFPISFEYICIYREEHKVWIGWVIV